jgi:hypothetical protein
MYGDGMEAREERVRSHSARVAILDLLAKDDAELTIAQIRDRLSGEPNLRSTHYHLGVLTASKLIVRNGSRYRLA